MALKKTKKKSNRGFTLVELMVVVAILTILAVISIPAIIHVIPNYRLRSLSYDLLATLQRARALAVQENQNITLNVTAAGFSFQVDSDGDGDIDAADVPLATVFADYGNAKLGFGYAVAPEGAGEDWAGNAIAQTNAFTFNSRGGSNAGTIYLDNGEVGDKNQQCYGIRVLTTGFIQGQKYVPCATNDKNCWLE